MAKWYGVIGYGDTVETSPGVWTEQITERYAKGEVIRNAIAIQSTDQLNEDIKISNSIRTNECRQSPYGVEVPRSLGTYGSRT